MKKEPMAICDQDEKYAYRLQEMLAQRESFPFEVSVYTDINREGMQSGELSRKYRLILAGEPFYELLQQDQREDALLLLLKDREEGQKADAIWKYQSGDRIRQQIMEYFSEQKNAGTSFVPGRKQTALIGVFSPVCREIQTSFSFLMGQFLAKKASVLYLNFEPFSGLSKLLDTAEGRDLTDLVYYLEGGRERLVYKLESMVRNVNGLDYISSAFSFVDLGQVKEESWLLLIRTLREMGNYDYILLDLSEMVQGVLNVLRECERVYTISDREGMALTRMEQYEELLQHLEYEDILRHTKKCDLPKFRKLPSNMEELPYGDLAGYVRGLLQEEFA
ncbi:MAG: hypothetical protein IJ600_00010 [Lachnospiraceae bacterium]|nr:hypothetical protein [Lachnospiraceae bacterium]